MPEYDQLAKMREGSTTGVKGQLTQDDLNKLYGIVEAMRYQRKRLTPEEIHNLGVLYGAPLSRARIKYFEDQRNRDPNQSYYGNPPKFPD